MDFAPMIDDEGTTRSTSAERRKASKRSKKWRLGIGLIGLAIFAALVGATFFKIVPYLKQASDGHEGPNEMTDGAGKPVLTASDMENTKGHPKNVEDVDNREKELKDRNTELFDLPRKTADDDAKGSFGAAMDDRTAKKASSNLVPKLGRNIPVNSDAQNRPWLASRCSLCLNKLGLVDVGGEFGTRIYDDLRIGNNRNQQPLSVSVYEDRTYKLNVQLDCRDGLNANTGYSPCSNSLTVKIWIDYNDNQYDDGETQTLRRMWRNDETPTGRYELDLYIPYIDGRTIKAEPHRAVLTVSVSEEYETDCGKVDYKESREYVINVVPKPRPVVVTTTAYRNPICFTNFPKIILVLMAGEKGTEIRDDKPAMLLSSNYQNPHHVGVTLHEHTIYLIRVQLDCSTQLRTELTATGCNLGQDVFVWIDLNDDGVYDDSEIGTPYRWPVTSYLPEGIYDLQIYVPSISARNIRAGPHRMRLVVLPSEYYRRLCGYNAYNETREHVVNIISKHSYSGSVDVADPNLSVDNIACSQEVGKIAIVLMAGEHRTQIRDDSSNNMLSKQNEKSIILYEGTKYLLRLQLECRAETSGVYYQYNCTLPYDINISIDLDDNGRLDDVEVVTPYRWPTGSYLPKGIYDLQLYIPNIDGRTVRPGTHRMRLVATLNNQYQRRCGKRDYQEVREYNITIVRVNQPINEINVPYLRLSDNVCSQKNAQISLVIVTGEKGTHIRDDTAPSTVIGENQNRHHMAVSLFDNKRYKVRIQLQCYENSRKETYMENCNLMQDVNILIDFNGDNRFSEAESRVPIRWPLRSTMPLGIYDYEIFIPAIGEQNMRYGSYTMRIVVTASDEWSRKCGRTDFREIRDYTINIIGREANLVDWSQ